MQNHEDLIRRGDALAIMAKLANVTDDDNYWGMDVLRRVEWKTAKELHDAIAALPAVTPAPAEAASKEPQND